MPTNYVNPILNEYRESLADLKALLDSHSYEYIIIAGNFNVEKLRKALSQHHLQTFICLGRAKLNSQLQKAGDPGESDM